ncbi:hypothetical protein OSTOST_03740 [Ostertagia ostertagi]
MLLFQAVNNLNHAAHPHAEEEEADTAEDHMVEDMPSQHTAAVVVVEEDVEEVEPHMAEDMPNNHTLNQHMAAVAVAEVDVVEVEDMPNNHTVAEDMLSHRCGRKKREAANVVSHEDAHKCNSEELRILLSENVKKDVATSLAALREKLKEHHDYAVLCSDKNLNSLLIPTTSAESKSTMSTAPCSVSK